MDAKDKFKHMDAARRKVGSAKMYKGKYAGPDKYKGVIPDELKSQYKGKYFGKEKYEGANRPARVDSGVKKRQPSFGNIKGKVKKVKKLPWVDESGVNHAGTDPDKMYAS